jgi:plasmid maintenance system antidote protein VapI
MELVNYTSDKKLSIYRISKLSNIPLSTLNDIYSGKSSLLDCSGKTLLSLSKVLGVSIEELLEMKQEIYKPEFEKNVPIFLKNSLDNLK